MVSKKYGVIYKEKYGKKYRPKLQKCCGTKLEEFWLKWSERNIEETDRKMDHFSQIELKSWPEQKIGNLAQNSKCLENK